MDENVVAGHWQSLQKKPKNLFLGFLKTSYVKFFQTAVLKKGILFKHGLLQALFKVLLL